MKDVVQWIIDNPLTLLAGICLVYNTVMSIVQGIKQRKFVKYSDIVDVTFSPEELAEFVLGLSKVDQAKFVEVLTNESKVSSSK